jgi:CDP-diacylglycerol--serine O-phosphatidyltransferase
MRLVLSFLIAFPAPAFAGVVEMPALEWRAPSAASAAPQLSVMPGALTPSLSLMPLVAAPAIAPAPIVAAVPARAAIELKALGAVLAVPSTPERPAQPGKALAAAFDGALSATAAPEPVQEGAPTAPAPLKPAQKFPRLRAAVPNLLTFSNMASGLAATVLAADGRFLAAGLLILAANAFDALDGRAARALKVQNALGIDLDSLADVVSFGAAPAILIFKAALQPAFGWWGFPVAAAFAAAGLYRLARFNVGAHAEKAGASPAKKSDSFTGLPIPGGAGVIVALTLALASIPAAALGPVAAAVTLLAAAAMVSRLPYPAFKKGGAKALIAPAVVGAAAIVPLALLGLPAFIPAAVFGLYLASAPLIALTAKR